MSAPNTDLEKQEKQHKGPLGGMAIGLIFAGLLLVGLIVWTVARGNDPDTAARQVEDTTGTVVQTAPEAAAGADTAPADPAAVEGATQTETPAQGQEPVVGTE